MTAAAASPTPVQRWILRGDVGEPEWLRPSIRSEVVACRRASIGRPLRWDHSVRVVLAPRATVVGQVTLERIAQNQGSTLVQPLGVPAFVASYAGYGGPWGGISRAKGTALLAAGLLPPPIIRRESKAIFNRPHFGPATRGFARSWDGRGVDPDLVDVEALRAAWSADMPPAPTAMLLQQAWLAAT